MPKNQRRARRELHANCGEDSKKVEGHLYTGSFLRVRTSLHLPVCVPRHYGGVLAVTEVLKLMKSQERPGLGGRG